jgi:hypothetical protein
MSSSTALAIAAANNTANNTATNTPTAKSVAYSKAHEQFQWWSCERSKHKLCALSDYETNTLFCVNLEEANQTVKGDAEALATAEATL